MRTLTSIFCLLVTLASYDCKASVYDQIRATQVNISSDDMRSMARLISKACYKYNLNCKDFVAILAHESMFKVNAYNVKSQDYGIGQINIRTIQAYNFDRHRILNDLEYSINAAAIVLSDLKRFKRYRICMYNLGPKKALIYLITCQKYETKVANYNY